MRVNPYINFKGTCAEAFRFYADLLGATVMMSMTYGESPAAAQTAPGWHDKVMHATLKIGDTELSGVDAAGNYEPPAGLWIALELDDPAAAERVWAGLTEGGAIAMPLQETFWAHRFGMVKDRFGAPWLINCSKPM
jgi:PhnB protein